MACWLEHLEGIKQTRMGPVPDLDVPNEKVIYIPFSPSDDDNDNETNWPPAHNSYQGRDLPGGLELRMEAYRRTWNKCLERAQGVIHDIQAPVVDSIVRDVRTAYSNVLAGLPYPEIPVIALNAQAAGTSFIDQIIGRLDVHDEGELDDDSLFNSSYPDAFITGLYPSECSSAMLAMKALITGFVQRSPDGKEDNEKRSPAQSLAVYDINTLEAWYAVVREAHGDETDSLPQLVVMLYEFEQFDPAVVQDMFYVCSLHVPRLPLIFILCFSSPPSPSYLRSAYSRSTLALLRVRNFSVPSQMEFLEELLTRIFFDIEFEPDVILGPSALTFLVEHFTQRTPSVDAFITILQLAHMKHFQEPLTIFVHETSLGFRRRDRAVSKILQPQSFAFLDSIVARLHNPGTVPPVDHAKRWLNQNAPSYLNAIDEARHKLRARAKRLRVAFRVMMMIREFMLRNGYKTAATQRTVPEMMIAAMSGKLGKDAKYLGTMVKKLNGDQLTVLLGELREKVPAGIDDDGVLSRTASSATASPNDDPLVARRLAQEFGDWVIGYFRQNLVNLEETELWDIWYTRSSPFPSELINPSIRNTILCGLLYPLDYVHMRKKANGIGGDETPALWELPDTSILFRRYLDSGKMINVYDWYESFAIVLEEQRRQIGKKSNPSPRKSASPRKGKGRLAQEQEVEEEESMNEEELERWRMEVQARFIRALHELDFLGFIKHTGRKADHVIRTVFEVAD